MPRSSFNEVPLVPATPKNKESSDAVLGVGSGPVETVGPVIGVVSNPGVGRAGAATAHRGHRDRDSTGGRNGAHGIYRMKNAGAFPDRLIRDDMLSSDLVRLNLLTFPRSGGHEMLAIRPEFRGYLLMGNR